MDHPHRASLLALLIVVVLAVSVSSAEGQLVYRYYKQSCPNVEKIIHKEVLKQFKKDPTIAPGILRLIFHDCFVRVSNHIFSATIVTMLSKQGFNSPILNTRVLLAFRWHSRSMVGNITHLQSYPHVDFYWNIVMNGNVMIPGIIF